ncbi:myosin-8-like isoform X3 [Betta splendens]|uniref:Myosin-8-like isoform X3 n=1 Tax=Betta splendens TaxID=158456 RepID=A0A6P7MVZ0_BETSP|nr:myosin-8-like isoform X3 [Betta splendens]
MDLNADSKTLSNASVGGQAGEKELSSTHSEAENEGAILLQLLEFKNHLLEAIEELHIRRDSETRFEDQLSKLVLEKQELEWEKESLQQQIETVENQRKESLSYVKKQFQDKIRNTEEEKWKYQLTSELKDKEISSLKEELKSLQLLKYNLERKSSELEQKLALQSRSKDSHLDQLGKVEKRFTALSRQCAVIKQAHVKLEQNVNEAMSINRKLSSTNKNQEAIIVSLKKELEEISKQLIKARMTSFIHTEKIHSSTGIEQHIQLLKQKLNTETAINKKLCKENESVRAEKQEIIKSLQQAEHLLLNQTQTVTRVNLELQTQKEQYQALKQEHEMMREKSKALEDKMAKLMESNAASKTSWDKEKTVLLGRIKKEQQDLQAVEEAHDALSAVKTMGDSSPIFSISTQLPLDEPIPTSELCIIGSLQHVTPSLTENSVCLEDTGVVNELVTTGATGEQETLNHDQQSQYNLLNLFLCPPIPKNLLGTCTNVFDEFTCKYNLRRTDPVAVSDLSFSSSFVSDYNLHIFQAASESHQDHRTVYGSVDLLSSDKYKNRNVKINEKNNIVNNHCKQEKNSNKEYKNTKQQCNREKLMRRDVNGGGSYGEEGEMLMTKTADRADRQEDNQRSTEDEGDTKNSKTETRDRVEGEAIDGVEERGKTAAYTSETPGTQIQDQTTTDTTIAKSNQHQVVDFMDTEPTVTVSEASDLSPSVSLKAMDTDFSHANEEWGDLREEQFFPKFNTFDSQSVNTEPISVQNLYCLDVKTQDANSYPSLDLIHQDPERTAAEVKLCMKPAADFTTEHSETLNESSICCLQKDAVPAPTVPMDPPDMCVMNIAEKGSLGSIMVKSNSLPILQHEPQSNIATQENSVQGPMSSNLEDTWAYGLLNKVEFESDVGSSSFKAHLRTVPIEDTLDVQTTESEAESEIQGENEPTEAGCSDCYKQPPTKQVLGFNTNKSFLQSNEAYRSSFCSIEQRQATVSRIQSDISTLKPLFEGKELNSASSKVNLGNPFSKMPMFLKSKHNKVPLVITRVSGLLNASSASGTAASLSNHPQGEWKALAETCIDTTAADTKSRTSLLSSFPSFASTSRVSKLSWQDSPGSSKDLTSAAAFITESDQKPTCSQEHLQN